MDLKEIPSLVIGLQMKISGNAWSLDRRLLQQMSPSHEPIMTILFAGKLLYMISAIYTILVRSNQYYYLETLETG